MSEFYSSDHHLGHKNIIDYSGRPYRTADGHPDLQAMHRALIDNWNSVVKPGDTVFYLGDLAFGPVPFIAGMRKRLNGKIILIRGNHDRSIQQMRQAGIDEVHNSLTIKRQGLTLYMAHIPLTISDPHPRKYKPEFTPKPPPYYSYWLAGHVHERWRRRGKVINVGVDVWGYTPRTLDEILAAEDGS